MVLSIYYALWHFFFFYQILKRRALTRFVFLYFFFFFFFPACSFASSPSPHLSFLTSQLLNFSSYCLAAAAAAAASSPTSSPSSSSSTVLLRFLRFFLSKLKALLQPLSLQTSSPPPPPVAQHTLRRSRRHHRHNLSGISLVQFSATASSSSSSSSLEVLYFYKLNTDKFHTHSHSHTASQLHFQHTHSCTLVCQVCSIFSTWTGKARSAFLRANFQRHYHQQKSSRTSLLQISGRSAKSVCVATLDPSAAAENVTTTIIFLIHCSMITSILAINFFQLLLQVLLFFIFHQFGQQSPSP